jgi:hypothetical protein
MSPSGKWHNELGSVMELSVNGSSITGTYVTAVGEAAGTYQLVGSMDVDGDPTSQGQVIAWVVLWSNAEKSSNSVTAWSGQYQMIDGQEEIVALWLFTEGMAPNSDWSSTMVNQDIFTRVPPEEGQITLAKKRGRISHPV